MKSQQIILASDHAGFALKEAVKSFLQKRGDTIVDIGAHVLTDGDDYPTYMAQAGLKVAEDMSGNTKAIIFGGSGQGEAMTANRFPGVRAVVWYGDAPNKELDIIKLSREHNDANVLSIGARFVSEKETLEAIEKWLATPFGGDERHARRNELIDNIE